MSKKQKTKINDQLLDIVYENLLANERLWKISGVDQIPSREDVADLLVAMVDSIQEDQSVMSGYILVKKIGGKTEVYTYAGDI